MVCTNCTLYKFYIVQAPQIQLPDPVHAFVVIIGEGTRKGFSSLAVFSAPRAGNRWFPMHTQKTAWTVILQLGDLLLLLVLGVLRCMAWPPGFVVFHKGILQLKCCLLTRTCELKIIQRKGIKFRTLAKEVDCIMSVYPACHAGSPDVHIQIEHNKWTDMDPAIFEN